MAQDFLFWSYFNEACSRPGCPICFIVATGMYRYIWFLLYESILDIGLRVRLLKSRGFCHEHAWEVQRIERMEWQDGLGVATLYEHILRNTMEHLEKGEIPPQNWEAQWVAWKHRRWPLGKRLAEVLRPHGPCPPCESRSHTELYYTRGIAIHLEDPSETQRTQDLLRASEGLCRRHLAQALRGLKYREFALFLLQTERQKLMEWERRLSSKVSVTHPAPHKPLEAVADEKYLEQIARMACSAPVDSPLRKSTPNDAEEPGDWEPAFRHPGCPCCFRVKARESALLHSLSPSPDGLLCFRHLRLGLSQYSSGREYDLLHRQVEALLHRFQEDADQALAQVQASPEVAPSRLFSRRISPFAATSEILSAPVTCPVCEALSSFEAICVSHFTGILSSPAGREWLRLLFPESLGLCLPHLRAILEQSNPSEAVFLRSLEIERMISLQKELGEYIRRHDYRYQGLPWGPEIDSWIRVIEMCVGKNKASGFKEAGDLKIYSSDSNL